MRYGREGGRLAHAKGRIHEVGRRGPVRVGGLCSAAGAGSRFGATKQLALLDGRPLLEHALAAVAGLHAARRRARPRGRRDPRRRRPARAPSRSCARTGPRGSRPRCARGVEALGDVDAAVVVLGDQPRITREAVEAVAAAHAAGPRRLRRQAGPPGAAGPRAARPRRRAARRHRLPRPARGRAGRRDRRTRRPRRRRHAGGARPARVGVAADAVARPRPSRGTARRRPWRTAARTPTALPGSVALTPKLIVTSWPSPMVVEAPPRAGPRRAGSVLCSSAPGSSTRNSSPPRR